MGPYPRCLCSDDLMGVSDPRSAKFFKISCGLSGSDSVYPQAWVRTGSPIALLATLGRCCALQASSWNENLAGGLAELELTGLFRVWGFRDLGFRG